MATQTNAEQGLVVLEMTMSLDGFIAGPNDSPENPMGTGGERLHKWVYDLASWRETHGLEGGTQSADSDMLAASVNSIGAIVLGKDMFDNGEEPWGPEPPFQKPVFVLTHTPRETEVKGTTTFTFVTDGIESALSQARAAANGKHVGISGGANVAQQFLKAGLVDEIDIHIAHVLLGDGVRLFDQLGTEQIELEQIRSSDGPGVTHLRFRVVK